MLILNEVGVKNYSEWEMDVLQRTISEIYNSKACLLIISNLPFTGEEAKNSLTNLLGDRIISRAADCDYIMIPFWWRDFRRMRMENIKLPV